MRVDPDDLTSIPGVGPVIAGNLALIGIHRVRDLKRADPERLYRRLERALGEPVDRCALYVLRSAVYFASHRTHDPEKLKWWTWKDPAGARGIRPPARASKIERTPRRGDRQA